jgi:hypothetical protein
MVPVNPGTKVMCFPDFEGPTEEFLVVEHDSIGKAYLVQARRPSGRTRSRSVAFCSPTLSP